jgi:hypothetical protein
MIVPADLFGTRRSPLKFLLHNSLSWSTCDIIVSADLLVTRWFQQPTWLACDIMVSVTNLTCLWHESLSRPSYETMVSWPTYDRMVSAESFLTWWSQLTCLWYKWFSWPPCPSWHSCGMKVSAYYLWHNGLSWPTCDTTVSAVLLVTPLSQLTFLWDEGFSWPPWNTIDSADPHVKRWFQLICTRHFGPSWHRITSCWSQLAQDNIMLVPADCAFLGWRSHNFTGTALMCSAPYCLCVCLCVFI